MAHSEDTWFDPDIESLELDWGEKAGLQIYRNYTRSFEDNAIAKFRETLARESLDVADLTKVISFLLEEDLRFLPVISCGYADDLLKMAFRKALPDGVPGGTAEMFGGYGPLSDLSKRIRLAYAFDVVSADLMLALDKVRVARNRISHDWDLTKIEGFHQSGRVSELEPIELYISDRAQRHPELDAELDSSSAFRVRLIWLVGRLTYEATAYHRAKAARLSPFRALYEDGGSAWLQQISTVCMDATLVLVERARDTKSQL